MDDDGKHLHKTFVPDTYSDRVSNSQPRCPKAARHTESMVGKCTTAYHYCGRATGCRTHQGTSSTSKSVRQWNFFSASPTAGTSMTRKYAVLMFQTYSDKMKTEHISAQKSQRVLHQCWTQINKNQVAPTEYTPAAPRVPRRAEINHDVLGV